MTYSMPNCAGNQECDRHIRFELRHAGVNVVEHAEVPPHTEVRYHVSGKLHGWTFRRAWMYWVAEGGPLSLAAAERLYADPCGKDDVRVGGHCGCPAPTGAVDCYHVDSVLGLRLLADMIREMHGRAVAHADWCSAPKEPCFCGAEGNKSPHVHAVAASPARLERVEPWQVWFTITGISPMLILSVHGNTADVAYRGGAASDWSIKPEDMACRKFLGWFRPSRLFPDDIAEWRATWPMAAEPAKTAPTEQDGTSVAAMAAEPMAPAQGGAAVELAGKVADLERALAATRRGAADALSKLEAERKARLAAEQARNEALRRQRLAEADHALLMSAVFRQRQELKPGTLETAMMVAAHLLGDPPPVLELTSLGDVWLVSRGTELGQSVSEVHATRESAKLSAEKPPVWRGVDAADWKSTENAATGFLTWKGGRCVVTARPTPLLCVREAASGDGGGQ